MWKWGEIHWSVSFIACSFSEEQASGRKNSVLLFWWEENWKTAARDFWIFVVLAIKIFLIKYLIHIFLAAIYKTRACDQQISILRSQDGGEELKLVLEENIIYTRACTCRKNRRISCFDYVLWSGRQVSHKVCARHIIIGEKGRIV